MGKLYVYFLFCQTLFVYKNRSFGYSRHMKCIILAAGRGERMRPLTDKTPKPLLTLHGKNLLQHKLDILPSEVEEVILIVGYLGQQIVDFFGEAYQGKKISYVWQEKVEGTGKAIHLVKELVSEPFLVLMGDDLYDPSDIKQMIQYPWSMLVQQVKADDKGEIRGGLVRLDEQRNVKEIREGIHQQPEGLMNTGAYVLSPEFFDYPPIKLEGREEWGLPQTLVLAAKDHPIKIVPATHWKQITKPIDLQN